jgi:alpha-ketoglutarate-dependent taurine dioxygenase
MRSVVDSPTSEDLARWGRSPVKEHPLVWSRRSGRKSLIIGNTAERVVGMPLPDGRALLARLLEWTAQPDFQYSHEWEEGDLVLWDNCGTLHRVVPYARDSGRTMHRTTIAGDEAVSA